MIIGHGSVTVLIDGRQGPLIFLEIDLIPKQNMLRGLRNVTKILLLNLKGRRYEKNQLFKKFRLVLRSTEK